MRNHLINKDISITAPLNKVWRVFTDPVLTKEMGGYYETDWKTGSAIGWKGLDDKLYTNGIILEFEPEKIIKHSLVDMKDNRLLSVITYEFEEKLDSTTISASEEIYYGMSEDTFKEVNEGWDFALLSVKQVAEK